MEEEGREMIQDSVADAGVTPDASFSVVLPCLRCGGHPLYCRRLPTWKRWGLGDRIGCLGDGDLQIEDRVLMEPGW